MAKYCFRVYLNDGSSILMKPSMIDNESNSLLDMDKFVYKCGDYFNFLNILSSELEIKFNEIDKVKIFESSKELEFSIVNDNPYLTPVLLTTTKRKVYNYKNYEMNTMVVPINNSSYIDMKNYLFENIQGDCSYFLNEVYKYNNEFARLLNQYGILYNQGLYQEEDLRNINNLKDKIEIGLSIYKNYRGLCKARYDFEKRVTHLTQISKNNKQKQEPYNNSIPEYKEKEVTQEDINNFNQFINYLGEEKEEFLDSDEIESEKDYGKRK